jgi:hypothetical protein
MKKNKKPIFLSIYSYLIPTQFQLNQLNSDNLDYDMNNILLNIL